jgi:hypothetical protein
MFPTKYHRMLAIACPNAIDRQTDRRSRAIRTLFVYDDLENKMEEANQCNINHSIISQVSLQGSAAH